MSGVSASIVRDLIADGVLARHAVLKLIPQTTLDRKIREGKLLSREEGDQISRLLRLKAFAEQVFDDAEDTETWFSEPNPSLGGKAPLELIATDDGSRSVETVLRRIAYGDYS